MFKTNAKKAALAFGVGGALFACVALAYGAVTPIAPVDYDEGCTPQAGVALQGDNANDTMTGTAQNDLLKGGGGNDDISGLAGDDCLKGEGDNDDITGSDGVDKIGAGKGDDTAHGDEDNDRLRGSKGADKLFGDGDVDNVGGADGADKVHGGPAGDVLACGKGNDVAFKQGPDTIKASCEKVKPEN